MEKTGVKNSKFRIVLAIIIAVLMLAYVVAMSMPFITYTQLDSKKLSQTNEQLEKGKKIVADWTYENEKFVLSPAEYAAGEETISLSRYLWFLYKHGDVTRDVLPNAFADAGFAKYTTQSTIAFPLFSYVIGIIGAAVVGIFGKKNWSIFFPIVWSFVTLLGYFVFPIYSFMPQTTMIVHIAISALVLVLSVFSFFMYSLPSMRYNIAHREKY